jgi:cytochrome c-type biogenesis protein CcmH/NrfG
MLRQPIAIPWIVAILILGYGSTACQRSPEAKEAAHLKRAQEFFAKKDYNRTFLELRNASSLMPKDAEPYYQQGLVYLVTNSPAPAVIALRKAIELNPKHSNAQVKLAELMLASRNQDLMTQAAAKIESVLESSPENPEAIDAMAQIEAGAGKPEDAAARLEELLTKLPSHLKSSVALTRLKLAQNDRKGAEHVLIQAVASAPKSAPALQALGEFYLMVNRPADAEAQFRKALQLEPKNAHALLRLASLQAAAGRSAEADETYKTLASLPDPAYRPLHAQYLYTAGKKEAAVQELESLNKKYPDDRAVRGRLIGFYFSLNRPKDAEQLVSAALKKNPKDVDALVQSSAFDLKLGRADLAADKLRQATRLMPDSARIHLAMAVACAALGQPFLERSELTTALGLQPTLLDARLALARNLVAAKEAKTALQVLDQASPRQQMSLAVNVERNWALQALGSDKELRSSLNKQLRLNRSSDLLIQDAYLRMRERDYAGARRDADEILQRNPSDAPAARLLAETYISASEPQKGLTRFSELTAAHPSSAPLFDMLGRFELRAGHIAEARQAFDRAKAADAGFAAADIALAELDRREKHPEGARLRLNAVVTADPRNLTAHLLLANLDEEANDMRSAIARYRSVLAADPSNLSALNNLAYQVATTNPDEALTYAQQAVQIAPGNPSIQDTVGWVYYRKGDHQRAVQHLKVAVDTEPTPRRQYHLAMGYLKLGDLQQGGRLLQAALKADPNLANTERGW